jgi:glucose-6-phosphate isomerase
MSHINDTQAWKNLNNHFNTHNNMDMRELFAKNPKRFEQYSFDAAGLFLDYSKNIVTDETLALLQKLTQEVNLREKIDAMFRGDNMNPSEHKPVLHVAMRNRSNTPINVQGNNVMPQINELFERIRHFVNRVRDGEYKGITGKPFTDVVNISIGGSNLGPQMVVTALAPYAHDRLRCHFVSNVDSTDITTALKNLNPETTLFIVGSKSFTTIETTTNADTAKAWLIKNLGEKAIKQHFAASTINPEKAVEYGIARENVFEFWTWVGGRFSVWSSIGMIIALSVGMDNFEKLLAGAHAMDMHFKTAPFEKNMPVILGLLGIWYHNFFNAESYSIVCYDDYLKKLPTYLQQVDMESNGKCVFADGTKTTISTGPLAWGDCGTNSQHSFHQLFHQGTHLVPIDFMMPMQSWNPVRDHHPLLVANCFAQAEALLNGKTPEQAYQELIKNGMDDAAARALSLHKAMPGNRPSNMILFDKVTPEILGAIMSLYELKIFVQGIVWGINSFDQWGVELGKELANNLMPDILGKPSISTHDGSTAGLVKFYHERKAV